MGKTRWILAALLMALFPSWGMAQGAGTVQGLVVDATTQRPLPGVQVTIAGTNLGASTSAEGRFQIVNVPAGEQVVRAELIGYGTVEQAVTVIAGAPVTVSLSLVQEAVQLEELVVTALGIERTERALTTATQRISGADVAAGGEANLVTALSGKVAGVTISNSNSPGGSSRMVIRGANSITGNNQPLFVVDGIPVSNTAPGWVGGSSRGSSGYNAIDYGNTIQDINPDDIESISVLKGPNAAALYGSRAANGAVIITTKKGRGGMAGQVTASTSVTFETPLKLPEYQNKYGQGTNGVFDLNDNLDESWGPRLDTGEKYVQFDSPIDPETGQRIPTPWVSRPNNVRDFFEVGRTVNTNAAFTASSDNANVRFSVSRMDHDGMYPNFDLERTNLTLAGGGNLTDRLRTDASVQYIKSEAANRPSQGYGEGNVMWQFLWFGRQVDINSLKAKRRNEDGSQFTWNPRWSDNPYWTVYENRNEDQRDRLVGNASVTYDITPWLSAMFRAGTDWYREERRQLFAAGTNDARVIRGGNGGFTETHIYRQETNTDFMLTGRWQDLNDFSLQVRFGGNRRDNHYGDNSVVVRDLVVPGLYTRSNSAIEAPPMSDYRSRQRVNSLYGQAEIGYRDYLFVELTGRNDWSSTLPEAHNSYFYPAISTSFIFTDAFPSLQGGLLSYGKVRAGWAQVGNDAPPYQLVDPYVADVPFAGAPRLTASNTLRNANLKPEETRGWEVGTELRFFGDRLGLTAEYFYKATSNQIVPIEISPITGFSSRYINAGQVSSRGIELMADFVPVRLDNGFEWSITANYTRIRDRVDELYGDLESMILGTYYGVSVEAKVGERYGAMVGRKYQRDPDGNIVIGSNGLPLSNSENPVDVLGYYTPDWTGGLTNRFSYRGFELSVLVDAQMGGSVYSQTAAYGRRSGVLIETLQGRENTPFDSLVVKGVRMLPDGSYVPNDIKTSAQSYHRSLAGPTGIHEEFVYDASFVKLREVTLGYSLPRSLTQRWGVNSVRVGLVGRNLALWTDVPHIDPETGFNASNVQGFEYAQMPSPRTFGFNISVTP